MTTLASEAPERLAVLDADSHITDVDDLWTKRAPAKYKDEILHVEQIDGRPTWVIEGRALGKAGGGSTIDRAGKKHPFQESMIEWDFERTHEAAWDIDARLEVLDEMGIQHQVTLPQLPGVGGPGDRRREGPGPATPLPRDLQRLPGRDTGRDTNNRLLPMPILPAWDIEGCVREAKRVAEMGLRGVNMTSDPQDLGSPDLANGAWDPLWEVCEDLELPVHFHIGASLTAMNFFGQYFWASQHEYVKPAIGGSMLFIGNARVVINTIFSGALRPLPQAQDGVGGERDRLGALHPRDHGLGAAGERAGAGRRARHRPSEYFKRNWYGTTWFETGLGDLQGLVDRVGEDNIMFETDFPHPTCLYPKPLELVHDAMATLRPESRRKILSENGLKLYKLA